MLGAARRRQGKDHPGYTRQSSHRPNEPVIDFWASDRFKRPLSRHRPRPTNQKIEGMYECEISGSVIPRGHGATNQKIEGMYECEGTNVRIVIAHHATNLPTFLTLRDTRTGTGFPAPVVFHSRVKRLGTEFFDLRREFRLQLFQLLQGFLLFLEIGLKQLGGIVLPSDLA